MKLTIIITSHNEKNTILKAIEEAKALEVDKEIIIIDNCSTDGTKEILKNLNDPSLRIVFQPKNLCVGRSAKLGIKMAKGDYLCGPGADLEYRMTDLYKMLTKIEEEKLDAVFGSRLLAKKERSIFRIIKERPYYLATIVATFLINKWYKRNFTDVIGLKLVKTDLVKGINLKGKGHDLDFELVSKLCKNGLKIGEIPIYYKPRTAKQGKTIKALDFLPALIAMFRVKLFG